MNRHATAAPRHWAQMSEHTFVFGIVLLYWIHRLLGRSVFRCCLAPVVAAYWLADRNLRAHSLQYLQRLQVATGALGHAAGWRDGLRHVARFADTILDKLLAASGRYRFDRVRVEGREQLSPTSDGAGGLIITAHLGCLELCRALAEHKRSLHLNILVHTRHAQRFNRLLKRLSPNARFELIEVTEVGPTTAMLLTQKVAAGEYVVIAGDRVPVSGGQTCSTPFLGHSACFPVGPWILAHLLQCPVWFLGCVREGDGYLIRFRPIATRVVLTRHDRTRAIAPHLAAYVTAMTELLARSPYDWFNFFPFWEQGRMPAPESEHAAH